MRAARLASLAVLLAAPPADGATPGKGAAPAAPAGPKAGPSGALVAIRGGLGQNRRG
jgi:hypothetical protein